MPGQEFQGVALPYFAKINRPSVGLSRVGAMGDTQDAAVDLSSDMILRFRAQSVVALKIGIAKRHQPGL